MMYIRAISRGISPPSPESRSSIAIIIFISPSKSAESGLPNKGFFIGSGVCGALKFCSGGGGGL